MNRKVELMANAIYAAVEKDLAARDSLSTFPRVAMVMGEIVEEQQMLRILVAIKAKGYSLSDPMTIKAIKQRLAQ